MAALVVLPSLAACGGPGPAAKVPLRIGVFSSVDYLPYFVMQEHGFAKGNGLEFTEVSTQGGAGVLDAMAAGSVDVGYPGSVPVLSAAARGMSPQKVITVAGNNVVDPDHPGIGVIVASSVNTWKDLEGQPIALNAVDSILGAGIKGRLRQEGVHHYRLVEISFPNMGLAVAGGNVAGAAMVEPFLTQSLLRRDGKLLGWVAGGPPLERMEYTVTVFLGDLYRTKPEAVKAFLRAHLQAVKWIEANQEQARSVLIQRFNLTPEVGQKVHLPRWTLDARIDPALLEGLQRVLIEVGLLRDLIPGSQVYDKTLLEQVLAEK